MQNNRVSSRIFNRPTTAVARRLLGCFLISEIGGVRTTGRIVETEAYHGDTDPACHCFYRRTARNEVMFHSAGTFYVYLIYGKHYCVNIVTEKEDTGAAVLIRAVEPLEGIDAMHVRRNRQAKKDLTNGPAKLCQAFGITTSHSGHHLTFSRDVWIEMGPALKDAAVVTTSRVGISMAKDFPWRFYSSDSPYVSQR